jgi:hypothetical protein
MQSWIVTVLVVGSFVYATWTLAPKAPRARLAKALLKLPLPKVLQKPLHAAARLQGGCGCDGCDTPVIGGQTPNAVTKPVTFMRKP